MNCLTHSETAADTIPDVASRRVVYWLLDHSMVARVVNARRNAGWFAEWPKPAQRHSPN